MDKMGRQVASLQTQSDLLVSTLKTFVTKVEFFPVKLIAYGLVAGTLGAVVTAIVNSVLG